MRRRVPNSLLAFLVAFVSCVAAEGGELATLELNYGKAGPLSESQATALQSTTLRLLQSSNFNSERHRDILRTTPREIHAAYRKTIAGRYIVVSFQTPPRISTVGGDIVVQKIVVGLNRTDYADSLFTIDAEGRIVSHGKYSGGACIELLNQVHKMRPDK